MNQIVSFLIIVVLFVGSAFTAALSHDPTSPYLNLVRSYADTLIEKGRDVYGEVYSPLFAAALNPDTMQIFSEKPSDLEGIRDRDRIWSGANPMHDQNFYQILYALTEVTGNTKYANEADKSLAWFFTHCQSPVTGLMAWGEHTGWDFFNEGLPSKDMRDIHEFFRPWVLWSRTFDLAPESNYKFALGLWNHQMADAKDGTFSRHASYSKHDPEGNRRPAEFPRHGGFYIATWAEAYKRTNDPTLLKAIEVLVDSFEKRRNPKSGAIPSQSTKPELLWPSSNLSLAIDLWDAAEKVPEPLASKMRASARSIDEIFLKIRHEPESKGFVEAAFTSTLEPGDIQAIEAGQTNDLALAPYSHLWATGYSAPTHAQIAMTVLSRYRQVQLDGYKKLFMATAERYLNSEPNLSDGKVGFYPIAIASAISVETNAYRLTDDKKYLNRANYLATQAVGSFFKGKFHLPQVSSKHSHYEAITGADTLAMELLDLWALENRPDIKLSLVWTDR